MMRARRLTRVGLVTLTVAVLAAGPAEAHLVRPVSSFTPTGVEGLQGVAVDQVTGDVYVTASPATSRSSAQRACTKPHSCRPPS